jgi:hypothetical protein
MLWGERQPAIPCADGSPVKIGLAPPMIRLDRNEMSVDAIDHLDGRERIGQHFLVRTNR